jgi:hypothetical protein
MINEKKWEITSISKVSYKNTMTVKKEVSDWLEIENELILHEDCVGAEKCDELSEEVIKICQRDLAMKNANGTFEEQNTFVEIVSSINDFLDMNPNNPKQIDISKVEEDVSDLPHYILGERQIAGIRYDPVKKQFYGKTILSVKKFKKSYVEEILPIEWVRENISEKFQNKLIGQARTKYLWVPIGNSNYGKKYPYNYNKAYPQIKYKQMKKNTCATSSLASLFHELGFVENAKQIEKFGTEERVKGHEDGLENIQKLIRFIHENCKDIRSTFQCKKLTCLSFDIFNDKTPENPKLIRLFGSDGSCSHAITIHNFRIYDSNLDYAVDLNKENLDYCNDAVYEGILFGYEFVKERKKTQQKYGNEVFKREIESKKSDTTKAQNHQNCKYLFFCLTVFHYSSFM